MGRRAGALLPGGTNTTGSIGTSASAGPVAQPSLPTASYDLNRTVRENVNDVASSIRSQAPGVHPFLNRRITGYVAQQMLNQQRAQTPTVANTPAPTNPIQTEVDAQRRMIADENKRLNSELEASRAKTNTGIARNQRARRGNLFEEASPNQSPFAQNLGG